MYKLSIKFCWFNEGKKIVKMYFINEMPFTFDELPDGHLWDEDLCKIADENRTYDENDMYRSFSYLVTEEVHPEFFPLEIENPELLPPDMEYYYSDEDLVE